LTQGDRPGLFAGQIEKAIALGLFSGGIRARMKVKIYECLQTAEFSVLSLLKIVQCSTKANRWRVATLRSVGKVGVVFL
jgi:hypothetical protein